MSDTFAARLPEMIADVHTRAAELDRPWDVRALDWPLTKKSVVVEVGGYTGRWALQIAERYGPRLFVFEPQGWAADVCKAVLGERARVYDYALGDRDGTAPMGGFGTDGCSFAKEGGPRGPMREIGAVFQELGITAIDLMLINIEGYEYELLPHMLEQGVYPDRLMVQWHTFADEDGSRIKHCRKLIKEAGYKQAWSYGVVLQAWERRL
jgi:FkbM family methyltransferase